MNEPTGDNEAIMRARELEIEVARLNAELETVRGEGEPTDIAARFLGMAATTVDQAMTDARREADELAAEVSAAAEARRDEATRIAEEAEARTDALRSEAADHESVVEQARSDAADITAAAEAEAEALIAAERTRVADEIERLSSVRTALEDERGALEAYHDELKRRVQELAESMVSFMTTEPPIAAAAAIEDLTAPELAVVSDPTAVIDDTPEAPLAAVADDVEPEPIEPDAHDVDDAHENAVESFGVEDIASEPSFVDEIIEHAHDAMHDALEADAAVIEAVETDPVETVEDAVAAPSTSPIDWSAGAGTTEPAPEAPVSPFAAFDTTPAEPAVATDEPIDDIAPEVDEPVSPFAAIDAAYAAAEPADEPVSPFAAFDQPVEPTSPFGAPAKPVEPSAFYDAPAEPAPAAPSFADMMAPPAPPVPPAPPAPAIEPAPEAGEFGGVPVVESETTAAGLPSRRPRLGGLFNRGTADKAADAEATEPEAPAAPTGGLFGSQGARLIEQTSPEDLAAALADESAEDERFRTFLDGDDGSDPSRDWLLRNEQG
ncbi:MAG: hypothetical protein AAF081_12600 [Actinomycetota bacterium]